MKVLSLFLALAASSVTAPSFADTDGYDWNHANLVSADGTAIGIDFQVAFNLGAFATPVWVNVVSGTFTGKETLRVTLQELARYYDPSAHGGLVVGPIAPPETVTLVYAGNGRFTGELPQPVDLNGTHDGLPSQSLAVQVDDWWLTDPISRTSTFQLDMDAAAGLEFR